jgi:hypothetical protein
LAISRMTASSAGKPTATTAAAATISPGPTVQFRSSGCCRAVRNIRSRVSRRATASCSVSVSSRSSASSLSNAPGPQVPTWRPYRDVPRRAATPITMTARQPDLPGRIQLVPVVGRAARIRAATGLITRRNSQR